MLSAAVFSFTTFPIYSVATAHAHDFATNDERVELSAALMFLYAVGAIASPFVTSGLIERFGPSAMFWFISAAHGVLIVFSIIRTRARPAQKERTSYVFAPRTSFMVGRLFSRLRDRR